MNVVWNKAIKQGVSSVCAVLITNLVDTESVRFTWPWFRHMLIAIAVLTALNEARYWKQWADGPDDPTGGNTMQGMAGKTLGTLAVIVALVGMTLGLGGCNAYKAANSTIAVVGDILTTAQAALPGLEASGVIPAKDVPGVTGWLNGVGLLRTQAQTCVTAAGSSAKPAALGTCLVAFATGLQSPAELADIRLLSKTTQAKVELWATAFVLGANGFCVVEGCATTPPPIIQSVPAPTARELHDFRIEAGLSPAFGY